MGENKGQRQDSFNIRDTDPEWLRGRMTFDDAADYLDALAFGLGLSVIAEAKPTLENLSSVFRELSNAAKASTKAGPEKAVEEFWNVAGGNVRADLAVALMDWCEAVGARGGSYPG